MPGYTRIDVMDAASTCRWPNFAIQRDLDNSTKPGQPFLLATSLGMVPTKSPGCADQREVWDE